MIKTKLSKSRVAWPLIKSIRKRKKISSMSLKPLKTLHNNKRTKLCKKIQKNNRTSKRPRPKLRDSTIRLSRLQRSNSSMMILRRCNRTLI